MKKKGMKHIWMTCLLFLFTLCGCLGKNSKDAATSSSTGQIEFLTESMMSEGNAAWQDNALDDLHAVINLSVKSIKTEGETVSGGVVFVGEGGCTRHGNHSYGDYRKDWDGVNGITPEGEEFSLTLEILPEKKRLQFLNLGPVSGEDAYVACSYVYDANGKASEYCFYELDSKYQKIHEVQTGYVTDSAVRHIMGDADGNYHAAYPKSNGKNIYVIISPEGEIIFEKELQHSVSLCAFGGGRVAVCEKNMSTGPNEIWCYEANLKTGELLELATSKDETVRNQLKGNASHAVPVDDNRIVWCTRNGIYVYDLRDKETKTVYKWSNHGIFLDSVEDMTVTADGSLAILYRDANEKGLKYLLLRHTDEKQELTSITIAVSSHNKNEYEKAATDFKKMYPSYVINVRDDYDEMSLLTQLGAGTGPALVDTELTGFENLEYLWEPLDLFMEQAGLAEEIIPKALEFGKIGDVTYGIVRDFRIETLLVSEAGPEDWNYEEFLNALEKNTGAAFTYEYVESLTDWREHYFDLLQNGLSDNAYFDASTGETVFGMSDFERMLRLSQKAKNCPPSEGGKALAKGTALCEHVDLLVEAQVFRLRRRMEVNGERAIGYPTKEGARHLLVANAPLAMRSTATEEQKKIAYTFLKMLLSKEIMEKTSSTMMFPVRKDVLEKKLMNYEATVESMKLGENYDPNYMPELDEKDREFLNDLIENGVVKKSFPTGLQRVFDEELGDYLAGRIDGKALEDHLKNRVWLYLNETK